MIELIQFLVVLVVNLIILLINLAIRILEGLLMLFPDPSGMPGLPGAGIPEWLNIGWLASILDLGTASDVIVFMIAVRTVELLPAFIIRAWEVIKP